MGPPSGSVLRSTEHEDDSHVETPNFGRIQACKRTHKATKATSARTSIGILLKCCIVGVQPSSSGTDGFYRGTETARPQRLHANLFNWARVCCGKGWCKGSSSSRQEPLASVRQGLKASLQHSAAASQRLELMALGYTHSARSGPLQAHGAATSTLPAMLSRQCWTRSGGIQPSPAYGSLSRSPWKSSSDQERAAGPRALASPRCNSRKFSR